LILEPDDIEIVRNIAAADAIPIAEEIWRVMARHQDGTVAGEVSGVNALACLIALERCVVPLLALCTDQHGWNEATDWFFDEIRAGIKDELLKSGRFFHGEYRDRS
jgi:hypothetical protein